MTAIQHDPTTVPGPLHPPVQGVTGGDLEKGPLPSQRFLVFRSDRRWMVCDTVAKHSMCACVDQVAADVIAAALNSLEGES